MIEIKTIEKDNAMGVDLYIEGIQFKFVMEMHAILNALEEESPELFHVAMEMFLAERGFGHESKD